MKEFLRRHTWLIIIISLGAILRIAWVYFVNTQPIFDFKHYHDLAMALLTNGEYTMPEGLDYIKESTPYIQAGTAYPTAFRPPGYPFFLVMLYAIYPSILTAKLANVGLGIVGMICIYALGKAYLGHRVGLGAAALTAIFPPAVYYTSVLGTEILSVTLLLFILSMQTFRVGGRIGNPLLVGALVGFLCLVKPYFAVFPVIYMLILWWQRRENLRTWTYASTLSLLCMIGMMAAVILPWTIRNYVVFDRFVPISTNGDFVLYQNNHDLNIGKTMDVMLVPNSIFKTDRILNADGVYLEPDAMKVAKEEALSWIWTHKAEYAMLGLKRLSQSYFTIGIEIWGWALATAELRFDPIWVDPITLGARAAGLVVAGSGLLYAMLIMYAYIRGRSINLLHKVNVLFILFFTAIIFATEGQPRYLFPAFPFFILGISWMGDRLLAALSADRLERLGEKTGNAV